MTDDTTQPFRFPAIRGKQLTDAFDGGRLSSDGGVMLRAAAARRMGIAEKLAAVIPDRRDPTREVHPLAEILLVRIVAIACGYEDADDLDMLPTDPAFKLACGRLPESGVDLMSQPTVSRWENAPTVRDLVRLGRVMVDLCCASYAAPPGAVVLDIDDTLDVGHGHQQPSLFDAHDDERCFLPIHVYDTATGRPVAMILRPGKTPSGTEGARSPKAHALAKAEFTTIRLRLLKVAARVTETALARPHRLLPVPARMPSSSATWQTRSGPARPEPWGVRPPANPLPLSNALPSPDHDAAKTRRAKLRPPSRHHQAATEIRTLMNS